MKRIGYLYEQMADWDHIVDAERICTRRKMRDRTVLNHISHRIGNLTEIQQHIINGTMCTGEYIHDVRKSGQDKVRDIAKLHFHPNHIQHQLLTMTAESRLDRAFIDRTYASRKGYGQTLAALELRRYLRQHRSEAIWYAQGDVCRYYDNVPHSLVRTNMERYIKDRRFMDSFMEPFATFAPVGRGIPLGASPSRTAGNVGLMLFDRYATCCLRCPGYFRYLDDFAYFDRTKGEVKSRWRKLEAYLVQYGFRLHPPKIHRVSEGIDILGYVYHGTENDMYWRKKDKKRWLRRRSRVSNPRRLQELDCAAWGMLKWGNRSCARLYKIHTGRNPNKERRHQKMAISFNHSGIKIEQRTDHNGIPFIDAHPIAMQMVLGKKVEILQTVMGIETSQGPDRYALRISFAGSEYKLIVNSPDIKSLCRSLVHSHVTRARTVFIDAGGKHYAPVLDDTEILEIDHRPVEERSGRMVFSDTGESVNPSDAKVQQEV